MDEEEGIGCNTTPETCLSDIVGRDLDVTGLGAIGHIGLTYVADHMLEVLNSNPVIQFGPLEQSFLNKTTYWGIRYGLKNKNDLTYNEALNIAYTAILQDQCATNYTLGWEYRPCKSGSKAQFRCDSFVYYAYLKGAGVEIEEFKPFKSYPYTLFSKFLNCRLHASKDCTAHSKNEYDREKFNISLMAIDLEENIDKEFAKPILNIAELDFLTKNYVFDETKLREEKIEYLWNLSNKYQNNPLAYEYITSILSHFKPDEIINEIINRYYNAPSTYNKGLLINLLQISALSPKVETSDFESIKRFYNQELQLQKNPVLVEELITNYPTYFPTIEGWEKVATKIKLMYQFPEIQRALRNTDFWFEWSKALNKNIDISDWIKETQYFVKDYALPFERVNPIQIDAYTAFVKGVNSGVGRQMLSDTGRDGIVYLNELLRKKKELKENRLKKRTN